MHATIQNPVLKGFNPDPSFLRVGPDFYLATSTFQWFPGVQIFHSRNLADWELVARPLNRISQLDMVGDPDSGGVWAPCLSYCDGIFYLIYSDVKTKTPSRFRDVHNYLVTTTDIQGDWSDPIFLNSSGFDPSLFHDGKKKYLVNEQFDFRKGQQASIILQEFNEKKGSMEGPIYKIFSGTGKGFLEAPHLYAYNGFYYLMTAEGGTGYTHAITLARSKTLFGPYSVKDETPLLTSSGYPNNPLQKAGHGSLVNTEQGKWYMAHLCSRPLPESKRCPLGRETAIQEMQWHEDGWLYLAKGGNEPFVEVPGIGEALPKMQEIPERDNFEGPFPGPQFQSLRRPLETWQYDLRKLGKGLRLCGSESLGSLHRQSLVARRQDSFCCQVTTKLHFSPISFQQMAGLIAYYDTQNYYYLCCTYLEKVGPVLRMQQAIGGDVDFVGEFIPLTSPECFLRIEIKYGELKFFAGMDENNYQDIGPICDASTLSDDFTTPLGFTGNFLGLCCQDLSGSRIPADFDFFEYKRLES